MTAVLLTKYYSGDKIKGNEMGRACSTLETGEVHTGVWWGDLRERVHLEDPGLYVRIILKGMFKAWVGVMDWIDLAQGRDRWRAFVNAVANFWV